MEEGGWVHALTSCIWDESHHYQQKTSPGAHQRNSGRIGHLWRECNSHSPVVHVLSLVTTVSELTWLSLTMLNTENFFLNY